MSVKRIYVQKKLGFDIEAEDLLNDIRENLQINQLEKIVILNRYDVDGITDEVFEQAKGTIFSEPQVDDYFVEDYPIEKKAKVFGIEFLPGQFDQRANALAECLQILTNGKKPIAKSAKIYLLYGNLVDEEIEKIKKYMINPVDSRECSLEKLDSLEENMSVPEDVAIIEIGRASCRERV